MVYRRSIALQEKILHVEKWDEFLAAHGEIGYNGCFNLETSISRNIPQAVCVKCFILTATLFVSPFLGCRLFALNTQSMLALITSKVMEHRATTATKRKELGTPNGVLSSFGKSDQKRYHLKKADIKCFLHIEHTCSEDAHMLFRKAFRTTSY